MLKLKNISKIYQTGELTQNALDKVSVSFRQNEFVSILGPSGSGKTTLLNIIGGLDRYTDGDLMINGRSTKEYKDKDWDAYRNNSIGFVFQSYNLIAHQSVLSNVELALTLAGVSRDERRKRAIKVLERVGLKDHLNKRPNQLSGGQMQRVAIARALVNDPEILLADEPTGALDTETSGQIMDLLKEIASDRLVIMVTHNPELAREYSTRIIRLLDGKLITDSDPYDGSEGPRPTDKKYTDRTTMSFFTALGLSLNNLATKFGRTLLTAFAGSIGIIGIALILSLSNGIQGYVQQIQEDTLANYPIVITEEEDPFAALLSGQVDQEEVTTGDDGVYASQQLVELFNTAFVEEGRENNLTDFKVHLDETLADSRENPSEDREDIEGNLNEYISSVQYRYHIPMNIYVEEHPESGNAQDDYRNTDLGRIVRTPEQESIVGGQQANMLWSELIPQEDGEGISPLILDQYELVHGSWPEEPTDVVLVMNQNNQISDATFFALGLISETELTNTMRSAESGESVDINLDYISYEELMDINFKLLLNQDYFVENPDGTWRDIREEAPQLQLAIEDGLDLNISGVIQPAEDNINIITGSFGYTSDLTDLLLGEIQDSQIIEAQLDPENENLDVVSGLPFELEEDQELSDEEKAQEVMAYFESLDPRQQAVIFEEILAEPSQEELTQSIDQAMTDIDGREDMIAMAQEFFELSQDQAEEFLGDYSDEELEDMMRDLIEQEIRNQYTLAAQGQVYQIRTQSGAENPFGPEGDVAIAASFNQLVLNEEDIQTQASWYDNFMPNVVSDYTLQENLDQLGFITEEAPKEIQIYANTFRNKENIDEFINIYNESQDEEDKIEYTDYVGLIMSGVTTIINVITYGLIAFVSISLVVSSIMIGIITYISVLERTKEIGILRSIGASKKDVSRVFNAETLIVGFTAGLIGIGVTLLLNIPINAIVSSRLGIDTISVLPPVGGAILIALSVVLTLIAGLIPSRLAAQQDPVEALRSE